MRFALASATLATLATAVFATNIPVQVGSGGLVFNPTSVTAVEGDTVQFIFNPKNHTVTQSTFTAPCQPKPDGIDSGYMPVSAGSPLVPTMTITVNNTDPLWFFCRQASHCEQGMVFAINPTDDKTFEDFQAAANASSSDGTPASTTSSSETGSSSTATSSSSATASNGAVAVGARAGGILAVVGFVAGVLL